MFIPPCLSLCHFQRKTFFTTLDIFVGERIVFTLLHNVLSNKIWSPNCVSQKVVLYTSNSSILKRMLAGLCSSCGDQNKTTCYVVFLSLLETNRWNAHLLSQAEKGYQARRKRLLFQWAVGLPGSTLVSNSVMAELIRRAYGCVWTEGTHRLELFNFVQQATKGH